MDLRRNASPDEIRQEIENMGLDAIDKMMTKWTFKQMLLKSAYSIQDMESMIAQTPFGKGRIDVGGIGFRVWLEK